MLKMSNILSYTANLFKPEYMKTQYIEMNL